MGKEQMVKGNMDVKVKCVVYWKLQLYIYKRKTIHLWPHDKIRNIFVNNIIINMHFVVVGYDFWEKGWDSKALYVVEVILIMFKGSGHYW